MQLPLDRRSLRSILVLATVVVTAAAFFSTPQKAAQSFTLEQIKSYPFPNELTVSASGYGNARAFKARSLTNYETDEGQELTSLAVSADGKSVVYVRGGDHGSNFDSSVGVNPGLTTTKMRVQIWSIPFGGGETKTPHRGEEP